MTQRPPVAHPVEEGRNQNRRLLSILRMVSGLAFSALAMLVALPQVASADAELHFGPPAQETQPSANRIAHAQPSPATPAFGEGVLGPDPRQRLELVRALLLARDVPAAKRQIRVILSDKTLPIALREQFENILRRINATSGWQVSARLKFAAPPGSGRHYVTDTVMLDLLGSGTYLPFKLDRKRPPDLGTEASAEAIYSAPLGTALGSTAVTGVFRTKLRYFDTFDSGFDEGRLDLSAGFRLASARGARSFALRSSLLSAGSELTERRAGVLLGMQFPDMNGAGLAVEAGASLARALQNDGASGQILEANANLQIPTPDGETLAITMSVETRRAEQAQFSTAKYAVQVSRSFATSIGLDIVPTVSVALTAQRAATPGFGRARTDREFGAALTLTKDDLLFAGRYKPFVNMGYFRHDSSIPAFSYGEGKLEFGFQSRF